jgi:dihydrofolate reductase
MPRPHGSRPGDAYVGGMEEHMRKLVVFNHVTLDGYFVDDKGDMSWAHRKQDAEWDQYVAENISAGTGGSMLFGRITYELMASYWPTPAAAKAEPIVAEGMNSAVKVVFSKTLDKASWKNTTLIKGDLAAEVRKMKAETGKDILIFGSGTIVSQLAQAGLIDEYKIIVNPLVIGKGRTMFEGVKDKMTLRLANSRSFSNGNVLLIYQANRT